MIAGFPDNQQIQNVLISPDNRVAVICEVGYGPSAQNRNTYPDRLSVWDFATQKLLVRFNSNPQDMLILCAVRPENLVQSFMTANYRLAISELLKLPEKALTAR